MDVWRAFQEVYPRGHRGLGLALIASVIASTAVVFTSIAATDINPGGAGDEDIQLATNTYVTDSDVTVTGADLIINSSSSAAAGDSVTGVEMANGTYGAINNALTAGNYAYQFDIQESGIDTLTTGEHLRVRVWGYDSSGPTATLLATLYCAQSTPNASAVEGCTATIDLGSSTSVYDSYDIIVDRQAEM